MIKIPYDVNRYPDHSSTHWDSIAQIQRNVYCPGPQFTLHQEVSILLTDWVGTALVPGRREQIEQGLTPKEQYSTNGDSS